jgi:hypothetical protein
MNVFPMCVQTFLGFQLSICTTYSMTSHARIFTFDHLRAGKALARPTSRCILFDFENISFDACLVIYINSTNIPPIMIINRIYEIQNLLSL